MTITGERWRSYWADKTTPQYAREDEEHYREYADELRLLFPDPPPGRVLEIGCGNGGRRPCAGKGCGDVEWSSPLPQLVSASANGVNPAARAPIPPVVLVAWSRDAQAGLWSGSGIGDLRRLAAKVLARRFRSGGPVASRKRDFTVRLPRVCFSFTDAVLG